MRKFILAVVLLLGVVFILWKISEVQAIVQTLQRGDWRFLLLALAVEMLWITNDATAYRSIYRAIGLNETVKNLLPVAASANFLNIVAPSVGMSGMAMFVAEARRRSYSPGKAAIAGALYVLFDYAAFLCVLTLGIVVLIRRDTLNVGELVASGILVFVALVLTFLFYLGMHSASQFGQALSWMARQVNRVTRPFLHRDYLSEERAREFAQEAAGGLQELGKTPRKLILPLTMALCKQTLLITVFFLNFLAFKVPVSPGSLIAGYAIGFLFLIVSPTPAGLGVVEGILPLVLSTMYIPLGAATVVTLAYRGFTFWFPLFFGMVAFRWLGGAKDLKESVNSNINTV